jgi:hypothetical protein
MAIRGTAIFINSWSSLPQANVSLAARVETTYRFDTFPSPSLNKIFALCILAINGIARYSHEKGKKVNN